MLRRIVSHALPTNARCHTRRHGLALVALASISVLIPACSASTTPGAGLSPVDVSPAGSAIADEDGLIRARHPECDIGAQIMRYLETGDNQGAPALDEKYAAYVHAPLPQARAIADRVIESCDQNLDTRAAASAQAAEQARQREQQQAEQARQREQQQRALADRQADLQARNRSACSVIGGEMSSGRCNSTVVGNPSGKPGAACIRQDGIPVSIAFSVSGGISPGPYSSTKTLYPGCFE